MGNLTLMVGELVGARLLSHAGSFVNAASQMNKAKIARTLACKTSLSARVDAFCASSVASDDSKESGIDVASLLWTKMQKRIDHVEGKQVQIKSKTLAGN